MLTHIHARTTLARAHVCMYINVCMGNFDESEGNREKCEIIIIITTIIIIIIIAIIIIIKGEIF